LTAVTATGQARSSAAAPERRAVELSELQVDRCARGRPRPALDNRPAQWSRNGSQPYRIQGRNQSYGRLSGCEGPADVRAIHHRRTQAPRPRSCSRSGQEQGAGPGGRPTVRGRRATWRMGVLGTGLTTQLSAQL